MTVVESQKCKLEGVTPCSGRICMVRTGEGVVYVCQAHYEEVFQVAWR